MEKELDLQAIETRLEEYRCEHGGFHDQKDIDREALLTALRELRVAAKQVLDHKCNQCENWLWAVLAKVKD